MKPSFLLSLALMGCTLILSGCGQKGPLYLPEKQTPPIISTERTKPDQPMTENNEKIEKKTVNSHEDEQ